MDISSALRTYYGYQGSETLEHYLFRSFQRFATGNDVEIHKAQGFEMHSAHAMQFLYQQMVKCLRDIDYNDWPMLDIRVRISAGETWLDISMILGSRLAFEIVRDLIMHAETVYGLMKLRITVSLGFV
ncbi:hypothetical protein MPER_11610 [Moniliophthora perniciosa FA553]|nr:hypothetical protein MPER_11610 [Moniliophthora perniciosa FA553]